ncbi:MAG: RNase adapter RapZ [Alphaproteobacteria bacterium]|nr:RNase adapter RapZ [Alphaproteobacteria bacterium]
MPDKNIIIVTGLSGAGISSALKSLEDLGYEVFDNFPLEFIDGLIDQDPDKPIAIGIDSRVRSFSPADIVEKKNKIGANLAYITCDDTTLLKRFTETRRKHPLAKDRPVEDGIKKEKKLLQELKKQSDLLIDTSDLSIHDLRRFIEGHYALESTTRLTVSLVSFGFKNGVPREADIVMDVRFLRNPHWDKDLKPLTGLNPKIGNYIKEDENFEGFITNFKNLIEPLLPRYNHEGKSYLTIAIGCTGGKHRSVFCVETLEEWLSSISITTFKKHRDLKV